MRSELFLLTFGHCASITSVKLARVYTCSELNKICQEYVFWFLCVLGHWLRSGKDENGRVQCKTCVCTYIYDFLIKSQVWSDFKLVFVALASNISMITLHNSKYDVLWTWVWRELTKMKLSTNQDRYKESETNVGIGSKMCIWIHRAWFNMHVRVGRVIKKWMYIKRWWKTRPNVLRCVFWEHYQRLSRIFEVSFSWLTNLFSCRPCWWEIKL